mmetsp:Transcript_39604/g.96144  ORF Transcript_39604/g.96144 Transcript_39604/m.96144 type:complete len:175 (-) Transcript_39604:152-676(-)
MVLLLLSCWSTALLVGGPKATVPPLRRARAAVPRCGFEVERLSQDDVLEMNVMNWPGLERRTSAFSQSAGEDEVKMVYVKEGEAVVSDADERQTVGPGNLVMIQGGETKWEVAEGSLTLISLTAAADEVTGEKASPVSEPPPDDLSLKEVALLLGRGLIFGAILALVTRLAQGT